MEMVNVSNIEGNVILLLLISDYIPGLQIDVIMFPLNISTERQFHYILFYLVF